MSKPSILFCHCAHSKVLHEETRDAVYERLTAAGCNVESVDDLCRISAKEPERLKELADKGTTRIAACYPRAVEWIFKGAGAEIEDMEVFNMRDDDVDSVCSAALNGLPENTDRTDIPLAAPPEAEGEWKPWFPVIDYDRCTNCMQCLSFCLFDVYGVSDKQEIQVQNQAKCKTSCPACSRVCPEVAIMFPKYKASPINGDAVSTDDLRRENLKVDISALLGGDIYKDLRDRSEKAKSRFSKERSEGRALKERQLCLKKLQEDLDIPPEVLASLPSMDMIQERAQKATKSNEAIDGS